MSETGAVVFVTPLVGRAMAADWSVVEERIAATVASLRAQRDPDWRMIVCGQDRPAAAHDDPRIAFLPFDAAGAAGLSDGVPFDKPQKLEALYRHLAAEGGHGYAFQLDADDLLHPDLVRHMRGAAAPGGYVVTRGYMRDAPSGRMAWLGEKSWRFPFAHSFVRECGSSTAVAFDFRRSDADLEILLARGVHHQVPDRMAARGKPLEPVPFPAAIYLLGHGENMRARRGKLRSKYRYLRRNRLGPRAARQAEEAFGLDD